MTLFAVNVARLVPPLATGKVPVTFVAALTKVVEVVPVPPLAIGKVPVTPVLKGNPVALVKVPLDGVPKAPPLTTAAPAEPTLTANAVATPVPSPDTPVPIGKPVALVKVPLAGVPNTGAVNTGAVNVLFVNVSVLVAVTRLLGVTIPDNGIVAMIYSKS